MTQLSAFKSMTSSYRSIPPPNFYCNDKVEREESSHVEILGPLDAIENVKSPRLSTVNRNKTIQSDDPEKNDTKNKTMI